MPHRRPNEPKGIKAYKSTLVNLMRYKHRINFPANYGKHVAPAICERYDDEVAAILAKPLLWACQDAECASMVPEGIRVRVLNALSTVAEQNSLPPW